MLRRLLSPSFRSVSLNEFEPTLKHYCQDLMEALQRNATTDGMIDVNEWFNRLSFDVFLCVILTFRFPEPSLLAMISGLLATWNNPTMSAQFTLCLSSLVLYANLFPSWDKFMYIPWMAEFLLKFPPPKVVRNSQYKQFEVGSPTCYNLMTSLLKKPLNKTWNWCTITQFWVTS